MKSVLVQFGDERFVVKQTVKFAAYLKEGEFIVHNGEFCKVVSAQANCPYIENLSKSFTAVLVSNGMGVVRHCRPMGKIKVYKR